MIFDCLLQNNRKVTLVTAFLFLIIPCFSQYYLQISPEKADSLKNLLEQEIETKNRIDILNLLTGYAALYEPERFDSLNDLALKLSKEKNYLKGEGLALYNIGFKNYVEGNLQHAISSYQEAVQLLEQTDELDALARAYDRLAHAIFFTDTDKQKALEYARKTVDLFHQTGNVQEEALQHLLLSGAYFRVNQPADGLESVKKFWELRDKIIIPGFYNGIALSIEGTCYLMLGDIRKSIDYNLKASREFDEDLLIDRSLKSHIESIIGSEYLKIKKTDSAIYHLHHSIALGRASHNAYQLMRGHLYLAMVLKETKAYEPARKHCDSSLFYTRFIDSTGCFYMKDSLKKMIAMSEEIFFPLSMSYRRFSSWEFKNSAYQLLWDIYNIQGRYKEANAFQNSWMMVRDSIAKFSKDRDLLELNIRYETEKKEQQLEMLSTENNLNEFRLRQTRLYLIVLTAFIMLIIVIALLLIRQNRVNARSKTIILEQRLLRSQMNPHFLFNSLSSIQGFMIEKDVKAANRYLSRFAGLIRNILDNSQEEFVPLVKEINTIQYYLELQQLRYEGKFDFNISIDEDLETETITIPPMLAQPFIENAIEHGMKHKETKSHIQINFNLDGDIIIFEVIDDGIGRERSEQLKSGKEKEHRSLATTITRERIDVLNKKYKSNISFEIIDLKDDSGKATGTKVIIRIPEVNH